MTSQGRSVAKVVWDVEGNDVDRDVSERIGDVLAYDLPRLLAPVSGGEAA